MTTVDSLGNEVGKLFVGGLNQITTEDSLQQYFTQFGEIEESVVMMDTRTNRSRGFGYIKFKENSSVDSVLNQQTHIVDRKAVDPKRCNVNMKGKSRRSLKIFVGGIALDHDENTIRDFFSAYGRVTEVNLLPSPNKLRHRGFAFVGFEDEEVVKQLINKHFLQINGKQVEVKAMEPPNGQRPAFLQMNGRPVRGDKMNNFGQMQPDAYNAWNQWPGLTPSWPGSNGSNGRCLQPGSQQPSWNGPPQPAWAGNPQRGDPAGMVMPPHHHHQASPVQAPNFAGWPDHRQAPGQSPVANGWLPHQGPNWASPPQAPGRLQNMGDDGSSMYNSNNHHHANGQNNGGVLGAGPAANPLRKHRPDWDTTPRDQMPGLESSGWPAAADPHQAAAFAAWNNQHQQHRPMTGGFQNGSGGHAGPVAPGGFDQHNASGGPAAHQNDNALAMMAAAAMAGSPHISHWLSSSTANQAADPGMKIEESLYRQTQALGLSPNGTSVNTNGGGPRGGMGPSNGLPMHGDWHSMSGNQSNAVAPAGFYPSGQQQSHLFKR